MSLFIVLYSFKYVLRYQDNTLELHTNMVKTYNPVPMKVLEQYWLLLSFIEYSFIIIYFSYVTANKYMLTVGMWKRAGLKMMNEALY